MLDTNMLIGMLAGSPPILRERVTRHDPGEIGISSVVYAEVALGSWNGKKPPLPVLDQVARIFEVVPFDRLAARQYAQLPFKRGSFDRLIAAHTLALRATLVTNNERDFADIPGLAIENWTR